MSLAAPPERFERKGVGYVVRPFEDGDRDGFLDVVEASNGFHFGTEWFDATYVDVPHLDHVPVVVVEDERSGQLVGVRPYAPFLVRGGDETALALLSRDTIVHPDHRRRGLFTTSTEYSLARYADSDVAFVFSHSNANSRPGYRKMGWEYPIPQVSHYRVAEMTGFVAQRLGPEKRVVAPLPGVAVDSYLALRDRLRHDAGGFEVTVADGVPVDTLAELHEQPGGRPAAVHPVFDASTLRYSLENPVFTRMRTYVARDGDGVAAALSVCPQRYHGTDWLVAAHVAPLAGDDRWERALSTLLGRALDEYDDVDAYRVAIPFPESVLASYGFLSDRHPPMSLLEPPRLKLGVRPLDGRWELGGESLLDARALLALTG